MTIYELINSFTDHVKQYGLDGDSNLAEFYKWEIITKYHDKLDTDSPKFAQNILEMNFQNLWYAGNQPTAIKNFVKYESENYHILHQHLYEESHPLQERVTAFIKGCNMLWDTNIKQNFPHQKKGSRCDERLISCFLAVKYPEKYTFYKNDVYLNICELFEVEPHKAGQKLVHFYELLNDIAGKTIWGMSDGYLMVCFDDDVNETAITKIAHQHPYYFVMRDISLATDNAADNFEQI